LGSNTKCLEVLFCYDFVNEVTYEEEDVLLVVELDLFTINTITLPKSKILVVVVVDEKLDTDTKISTYTKINTKEQIFDFPHALGEILVDITPTQIKMQDMKITKWNISKKARICPLNLGTHNESQLVK
jgi:hypothetical protein